MSKCVKCGKKSIFLSVDSNGLCGKCSSEPKNAVSIESPDENKIVSADSLNIEAGNFFDIVMNEFLDIVHSKKFINGSLHFVPNVYTAGNMFTYSWLCDEELAKACVSTTQVFHNIAIHAIFGGAFFAYAWTNNPESFDPDNLYAISRISDVSVLGSSHMPYSKDELINLASELFEKLCYLLDEMNFSTQDQLYNNVHKGLWAIFCIGAGMQFESTKQ